MAVLIAPMPSKSAEEVQKKFGARMRALRQQTRLSQEELAFSCSLDRTYIGSVERASAISASSTFIPSRRHWGFTEELFNE